MSLVGEIGRPFTSLTDVGADVVRCLEVDPNGTPFAQHFFALCDDVKEAWRGLSDFQDDVVGPSFFEGQGDLRWNNYLYFITPKISGDDANAQHAKAQIESDRNYARKFVVTADELKRLFEPAKASAQSNVRRNAAGLVERWTSRLVSNGLGVVLDQMTLAETARKIADGAAGASAHSQKAATAPDAESVALTGFVEELKIGSFRAKPSQKHYRDLGRVNLIYGPNGTGKTTFLEAIEHIFCGATARTPSTASVNAMVRAPGAEAMLVSSKLQNRKLKERNLWWYGVRDLRGSTLCNSFARFNFLCTDEPVLLGSGRREETDELVARMVAGPVAADLWGHIERLHGHLEGELSAAASRLGRAQAEHSAATERLKSLATRPSDANSIYSKLSADLSSLRWQRKIEDNNVTPLQNAISKVAASVRGLVRSLDFADAITPASIRDARDQMVGLQAIVRRISERAVSAVQQQNSLKSALTDVRSKLQILQRLATLAERGLSQLLDDRDRLTNNMKIVALDVERYKLLGQPLSYEGYTPDTDLEMFEVGGAELASELASAQAQLSTAQMLAGEIQAKLAALQRLGIEVVHSDPAVGHCPLCRTEFGRDELIARLEGENDARVPEAIRALERRVGSLAVAAKAQERVAREMATLRACAAQLGMPKLSSIGQVAGRYHALSVELASAEQSRVEIAARLDALSQLGITEDEFRQLQAACAREGLSSVPSELSAEINALQVEEGRLLMLIEEGQTAVDALKAEFEQVGNRNPAFHGMDLKTAMTEINRRAELLNNGVAEVELLADEIGLDGDSRLVVVAEKVDGALNSCMALVSARRQEEADGMSREEATKASSRAEVESSRLKQVLVRLQSAVQCLGDIIVNDSLPRFAEEEIRGLRSEMQSIFGRIHSPHEYEVHEGLSKPLKRLGTSEVVTLNQISTGQRAAYVLSLFLGMNAQLSGGPRVVLLDDPVAHVDDLNALSFLDYLRQLVLVEERQIFYATADARMAGLFEHKFRFLGRDFRKLEIA
jgi:chromosome segregation protein